VPFVNETSAQLTGPEKDPENKVPLGTPLVPFPVTVKEPPAANVPPMVSEPPLRAPVENATVPRSPVTFGLPPWMIATKVDPERLKPLLDPANVPPMLLKSTLLSANEAAGIIRQTSAHNRRVRDRTETIVAPCRRLVVQKHTTDKPALE
jgi:hypothetical protein